MGNMDGWDGQMNGPVMGALGTDKSMGPQRPSAFPTGWAVAGLTVAAGVSGVVVCWLTDRVMGLGGQPQGWVIGLAVGVWVASLIALGPVVVLGPLGVMPTVWGYFLGMGVRLIACVGIFLVVVGWGGQPVRQIIVVMTGVYVPLLMVEVGFVGHYLWWMDARAGLSEPDRVNPSAAANTKKEVRV